MAKGRTKNKRARKPETIHQPVKWPPPAPTAYLTITDGRHGYADAALGAFYDPLQPIYSYRALIHPGPAMPLQWHPGDGWTTELPADRMQGVITAVERIFSPMNYRFEPIYI